MRSLYNIAGQSIDAQLLRRAGKPVLTHDNQESAINIQDLGDDEYRVTVDDQSASLLAVRQGDQYFIHLNGRNYLIECEDEAQAAAGGASDADRTTATAPMPGTVVSVSTEAGQAVSEGDTLIVIESMKMETTISAWRNGTVAAVNFNVGDSFDRLAVLVQLEE